MAVPREQGRDDGRQTHWGGLVGIYNYPTLIDGGQVTAPRVAFRNLNGELDIENKGVAPDVDVDLDPKLWRQGHDVQLEKAVELTMTAAQKIRSGRRTDRFRTFRNSQTVSSITCAMACSVV